MIVADYIWIDGKENLRSKIKVIQNSSTDILNLDLYPHWTFDGSSCYLSDTRESDLILKPVRVFLNPFYKGEQPAVLVLCEIFITFDKPHPINSRSCLTQTIGDYHNEIKESDPWFGIEQEYVIFERNGLPLEWISHNNPGCGEQGPYYCSIGGEKCFGRKIVEDHLQKCLQIGLKICGINSEVMPSQWEFQIGPLSPLEICDQIWIARYILIRVAESFGKMISFHPKPYLYNDLNLWNGSGGHTNISTKKTREKGGLVEIKRLINQMSSRHSSDISKYGNDNDKRLTSSHETSSLIEFTSGYLDRSASIRIPVNVLNEGQGYFEDRRPAANMDPYLVIKCILNNIL